MLGLERFLGRGKLNRMKAIAIIPARMGSSRFPGKPLAEIHGLPMVGHCFLRTQMCPDLIKTYVATCDKEIADYVTSIGGNAILTSDSHERATDRTAEAMLKAEADIGFSVGVVVMVQGDEPLITAEMIEAAVKPMLGDNQIQVTNLLGRIETEKEFHDRNCIKVVHDINNDAMFMSREPIPTTSKGTIMPMGKQICVIPFRRNYLLEYNSTKPTKLEICEAIDMNRVLENGHKIRLVPVDQQVQSVDTPEDLILATKLMTNVGKSSDQKPN